LTNQKENTCVFQGRDFNEKYGNTSSIFSIYIGIVKKQDTFEISYAYKVFS